MTYHRKFCLFEPHTKNLCLTEGKFYPIEFKSPYILITLLSQIFIYVHTKTEFNMILRCAPIPLIKGISWNARLELSTDSNRTRVSHESWNVADRSATHRWLPESFATESSDEKNSSCCYFYQLRNRFVKFTLLKFTKQNYVWFPFLYSFPSNPVTNSALFR